ncbi:outer membrane protein [Helicobacter suis HS5]|uniref:Outer membrane protein n=9 Tax=Helicobacter suis TaxID=104628 RepID=E7G4E7_9HELI|nr:outer membrane protein [Helicobacter suis HS5]
MINKTLGTYFALQLKLLAVVVLALSFLGAKSHSNKLLKSLSKERNRFTSLYNKQKQLKAKNGGFFGMGLGTLSIKAGTSNSPSQNFPIVLSFKGGFQSYFNNSIGLKVFAALDLATSEANWQFNNPRTHSFFGMVSAGLSLPIEFSLTRSYQHFLGFYGGVGAGFMIYMDNEQFQIGNEVKAFGVVAQAGISLTLYSKHHIEAGFKILPTDKSLPDSKYFKTSEMFNIMYLYKF